MISFGFHIELLVRLNSQIRFWGRVLCRPPSKFGS